MTNLFNQSEDNTTETDDNAIAMLAIHGFNTTPKLTKTPAAIGTPIMLYRKAYTKLM